MCVCVYVCGLERLNMQPHSQTLPILNYIIMSLFMFLAVFLPNCIYLATILPIHDQAYLHVDINFII